jgi:hypothetical protein
MDVIDTKVALILKLYVMIITSVLKTTVMLVKDVGTKL